MTAIATVSLDPPGCARFAPELPLFVDGELGEVERSSVEEHLSGCATCREAVRFREAMRSALRRASEARPVAGEDCAAPAGLRARIRLSLDGEETQSRSGRRFGGFWSRPLWARPIAAAGAGATALGLTAWLWFGGAHDDVVRDIVVRHARRLPLEFQGNDAVSLERWLADKVQFHVQVPRLEGRPYNLVGARLSHVKDHDAVYMVFGSEKRPDRRLAMFVYDDATGQAAPPGAVDPSDVYVANSAGYNVAVWKQNQVVYSLVSDGEDDVLELVRAARGR